MVLWDAQYLIKLAINKPRWNSWCLWRISHLIFCRWKPLTLLGVFIPKDSSKPSCSKQLLSSFKRSSLKFKSHYFRKISALQENLRGRKGKSKFSQLWALLCFINKFLPWVLIIWMFVKFTLKDSSHELKLDISSLDTYFYFVPDSVKKKSFCLTGNQERSQLEKQNPVAINSQMLKWNELTDFNLTWSLS